MDDIKAAMEKAEGHTEDTTPKGTSKIANKTGLK